MSTPSVCCRSCAGGRPERKVLAACGHGHDVRCVRALLAREPRGANARSTNGSTPLMVAAAAGRVDAVELLIRAGARVDATSADEDTALLRAVRAGQLPCVAALLGSRANVETLGRNGVPALVLACELGRAELCALLLAARARIEQRAVAGFSALQVASLHGSAGCVGALLRSPSAAALVASAPSETSALAPLMLPEGPLHVSNSPLSLAVQHPLDTPFPASSDPAALAAYAAALARSEQRSVRCAALLLAAGAAEHLAGADGNLLVVAARQGLFALTQLLAAHGAPRAAARPCADPRCGCAIPETLATAERAAEAAVRARGAPSHAPASVVATLVAGPRETAAWLRATAHWSTALHHFSLLPPERVRLLLRAGADVHARALAPDARSPLELAEALATAPRDAVGAGARTALDGRAAAALVRAAAASAAASNCRWGPISHALYSPAERARAVELALAGHALTRRLTEGVLGGRARELLDVWMVVVLPLAMAPWRRGASDGASASLPAGDVPLGVPLAKGARRALRRMRLSTARRSVVASVGDGGERQSEAAHTYSAAEALRPR